MMVDEFDLLLLACLAGGYFKLAMSRGRWPGERRYASGLGVLLPIALLMGTSVALFRGLFGAEAIGFHWFQGYADPGNTLRVGKSILWAGLAVPLLRDALHHESRHPVDPTRRLACGMVAGLALVCLGVLWERAAFPGIFDFTSRYRITAMFWEMHVGGAAIDGYLALATPFVVWALRTWRTPWRWTAAAALAVLATYAALTTFSRGVYLAVAAPLALLAVLLWLQARGLDARAVSERILHMLRPSNWRARAGWALALALVLEVIGVLNGGSYMGDRIATADRDFGSRLAHWQRGVQLLETPSDWWLGQGLGRLPALYPSKHPEESLSGHVEWVESKDEAHALPGAVLLYGPSIDPDLGGLFALTQRVEAGVRERYRARLQLQTETGADLHLQVCERHLLYNGTCQYAYATVTASGDWQSIDVPLRGRLLSGGAWYAPRPAIFTVSVLDAGQVARLRSASLVAQDGQEKLQNHDFTRGLAHWLPSAQSYFLPWHIDNLYLELLIERGWLGLSLTLLLLVFGMWRLLLGRARRHPLAPYLAASLSGVMLVGLVSSVMDVPRVAFLMFWLAFLSLQLTEDAGPATHAARA